LSESQTAKTNNQPKTAGISIDSVSKAVAVCIALLYVSGFLITSLHDFNYGFLDMNPLRPRILAAGGWFLVFLIIPLSLVTALTKHKLWNKPDEGWFKLAGLGIAYYTSSRLILIGANFVFDFDKAVIDRGHLWQIWAAILVCSFIVIGGLAFSVSRTKITKKILTVATCVFLAFFLLFGADALFSPNRFHLSAITLWMMWIGVLSYWEMNARSWKLTIGSWPQSLVFLLAVLAVFAIKYYPHIKSSWGGGTPIPVTITLTKDSPVLANQRVICLLIDETDLGFYVIGNNDKYATFLPRGSVALMRFSDSNEPSIFTPNK
jgi:hypothetical protein